MSKFDDEAIEAFILAGLDRLYPGACNPFAPGFATHVKAHDVEFLAIHASPEFHLGAGVASGMTFSVELVRAVAELNKECPIGAYFIKEGQPNHWMVGYSLKLLLSWVDPSSSGSAQMILDAAGNLPDMVNTGVDSINPESHGGYRWDNGGGFMTILGLMSRL